MITGSDNKSNGQYGAEQICEFFIYCYFDL